MASSLQTFTGTHGTEQQNGQQRTEFGGQDIANIRGQMDTLANVNQGQQGFLNQLQQQFSAPNQQFNYGYNTNPNLNTNFQTANLSPELGVGGKQLLSQAQGQNQAQLGTQLGQIQQQFGQGANANQGLANILKQQTTSQNQLNNNPLLFQAKQAENQMAQQQVGLNNQAIGMSNEARLQNAQGQNQGLGMYNQTLGGNLNQASAFGQQGLQNNNAMLSALQNLGQQFGTQVTAGTGRTGTSGVFGINS